MSVLRKGSIYKIECLCTNKVYIGQTIQHPPIRRWVDHYKQIYDETNNLYLYRAFRRWGISNFIFQILEENIEIKELSKKEQSWISKYNASDPQYGYNLTSGGVMTSKSVINEQIAKTIIQHIKTRKEMTFVELAAFHNVSREIISDINCGETWYFIDEKYPIRDNSSLKNVLTENDVYAIYELLKKKTSLTTIAKTYGVSVTNISNINKGKIYKFLDERAYPIYLPVNSKKWLDENKVAEVIHLLKTTNHIYAKIGDSVGVGRKTVSGINNGTLYKETSSKLGVLSYPIR